MTYFQFDKLMQGNPVDISHQVTWKTGENIPLPNGPL